MNASKKLPKRWVFEGCQKKNFYDTEWEAVRQAAVRRDEASHANIEAYKCLFCPGWHIGHTRVNGQKVVPLAKTKRCPQCHNFVKETRYDNHMIKTHPGSLETLAHKKPRKKPLTRLVC